MLAVCLQCHLVQGSESLQSRSGSPALLSLGFLLVAMAAESEVRQYLAEKVESELLYIWGEKEIELGEAV